MVEQYMQMLKDPGRENQAQDAYPTKLVGGTWEGSFDAQQTTFVALNHIVPAGQQLKLLFLRVYTQEATGARFSILQTNPAAAGATGTVEAFPVVGSVPPHQNGQNAVRDRPFLEAPGSETLRGGLRDPVNVFEGSIDFRIHNSPTPATGARYCISWFGLQDNLTEAEPVVTQPQ